MRRQQLQFSSGILLSGRTRCCVLYVYVGDELESNLPTHLFESASGRDDSDACVCAPAENPLVEVPGIDLTGSAHPENLPENLRSRQSSLSQRCSRETHSHTPLGDSISYSSYESIPHYESATKQTLSRSSSRVFNLVNFNNVCVLQRRRNKDKQF